MTQKMHQLFAHNAKRIVWTVYQRQ